MKTKSRVKPGAKAKPGDARIGNTSWKERQKHGRDREFKTEAEFKKAWDDYFHWADTNPWYKNDFVRGGESAGKIIKLPTQRPYTIQGFQAFHDLGHNYIEQLEKSLKEHDDTVSIGISGILSWARNKCYVNKFEGAAVGAFNASVIMRDLGLREKTDVDHTTKGDKIITPPAIQVYNVGPPLASDESEIDDKKSNG